MVSVGAMSKKMNKKGGNKDKMPAKFDQYTGKSR